MLILDSNIWILSLIESDGEHAELREQIENGDERSAVDAYIYNEVVKNLRRVPDVNREEINGLIEDFTAVIRSSHIETPTQTEIERLVLDEVRNRPAHITLARALRIQPKDAPFVAAGRLDLDSVLDSQSDDRGVFRLNSQCSGKSNMRGAVPDLIEDESLDLSLRRGLDVQ